MNLLISYLTLRKSIGILALLFPFVLILTGFFDGGGMETSLSAYYWTNAGVLFTSMLVTFGIFLLTYKGYDRRDELITSIAGIAMILVALFPTKPAEDSIYLFTFLSPLFTTIVHFASAFIAFGMLGVMSYFQFTQSAGSQTWGKVKRNKVYKACGIVIFASLLLIVTTLIPSVREWSDTFRLFFWLETIIVIAFGMSWLVKGEAILKDGKNG